MKDKPNTVTPNFLVKKLREDIKREGIGVEHNENQKINTVALSEQNKKEEIQPLHELERISRDARNAADEHRSEIEKYYVRLASECENGGIKDETTAEVMSELEALKRTRTNLRQAYQDAIVMQDELGSRYDDMQKQRSRKIKALRSPTNGVIDLEEEKNNHFARGISVYKLLLVCFIGSFIGVVLEMLWCLIQKGYIESRAGLVWGPFNLLYGIGAVALTLGLYKYRNHNRWLSFFVGMLVGSVVEYVCSWAQEMVVGSRSWDYSNFPFNLNGRICLLYSIFWGFLGMLWIKEIYPRFAQFILKLPNKAGKIATWCVTIFLIVNAIVTLGATYRWSQRVHGEAMIEPKIMWSIFDERFPDERMERIFANMEW